MLDFTSSHWQFIFFFPRRQIRKAQGPTLLRCRRYLGGRAGRFPVFFFFLFFFVFIADVSPRRARFFSPTGNTPRPIACQSRTFLRSGNRLDPFSPIEDHLVIALVGPSRKSERTPSFLPQEFRPSSFPSMKVCLPVRGRPSARPPPVRCRHHTGRARPTHPP